MKTYTSKTKIGNRTLFFTASWCGPCQSMKRALAKDTAKPVTDKLLVVDIDSAAGMKLAEKHGVRSIPTFMRPDGESQVGAMPVAALAKWIAQTA